jgi:hypothetical protein
MMVERIMGNVTVQKETMRILALYFFEEHLNINSCSSLIKHTT